LVCVLKRSDGDAEVCGYGHQVLSHGVFPFGGAMMKRRTSILSIEPPATPNLLGGRDGSEQRLVSQLDC
jgi:hypothetical protein